MIHDVIYYIALSLCLISIIGVGVLFNFTNKVRDILDLQGFLKKYAVFGIGLCLIFVIGFILFDYAFFIDETTINILHNELSLEFFDSLHLFLSYFFGILFFISIFIFIYAFYIYYYLTKLSDKEKKIVKLIFALSIPLMIITFIAFMEGNAPYFSYPLANAIYFGKEGILLINSYHFDTEGGFHIALYALIILGGAILVLFLADHLAYKKYKEHGLFYMCFLIAFPCGVIGARAWYVILDITQKGSSSGFITNPISIFQIWYGGLGIMGGAILGIIGGVSVMLIYKYALKRKPFVYMNYLYCADFIIPAILIAQAIGRWGNFFNNEVNGELIPISSLSWLPTFIVRNMQFADHGTFNGNSELVYLPLFFIEFCTNLFGYFFIYYGFTKGYFSLLIKKIIHPKEKLKEIKPYNAFGTGVGLYLVWYGITRAILEPLRTSSDYYGASVTSSYVLIGAGIFIIILAVIFKEAILDKGYPNIILKDLVKKEEDPTK